MTIASLHLPMVSCHNSCKASTIHKRIHHRSSQGGSLASLLRPTSELHARKISNFFCQINSQQEPRSGSSQKGPLLRNQLLDAGTFWCSDPRKGFFVFKNAAYCNVGGLHAHIQMKVFAPIHSHSCSLSRLFSCQPACALFS